MVFLFLFTFQCKNEVIHISPYKLLLSGQVHGMVADRHRSREFVQYLKMLDETYSKDITIRMILDRYKTENPKMDQRDKRISCCFPMEMEIRHDFSAIIVAMLIRNRSTS